MTVHSSSFDNPEWIQVDCRPTHARFRNKAFFYNDVKIDFGDWSLGKGMQFSIYKHIIIHDDEHGWATINLEVCVT